MFHIHFFWYTYFGDHYAVSLTTDNDIHGVTLLAFLFVLDVCCVFLPPCQCTCPCLL